MLWNVSAEFLINFFLVFFFFNVCWQKKSIDSWLSYWWAIQYCFIRHLVFILSLHFFNFRKTHSLLIKLQMFVFFQKKRKVFSVVFYLHFSDGCLPCFISLLLFLRNLLQSHYPRKQLNWILIRSPGRFNKIISLQNCFILPAYFLKFCGLMIDRQLRLSSQS